MFLKCFNLFSEMDYLHAPTPHQLLNDSVRGHGGAVVTNLPATSEVGSSNPSPYVGKLVAAYRWSAVYCTEP